MTVRVWEYSDTIEFEGEKLKLSDKKNDIEPGDVYIAGRNTGPHLLTCRSVSSLGFIVPEENQYPFDIYECRKVLSIESLSV